ncbi:MAG TPA: M20 aminoacylase family protein [Steroidobacteraceae bacterium]|nr:M20 aminoacylase family protein [Steroidobacteraceae bacterium]
MGITDSNAADLLAEAVSWRRHLHQHPELAFGERQTAQFVASQLERFGLKVHRGLAGTGVVGTLTRGTGRRSIGIRADMDALPIREESGAPHVSSVAGVMHACGHDGHTAIALAAARTCAGLADLDGTVHFIFQPAEENEGGGRRMVEEGLFESFPCDSVYALHNWPALPVGTCVARDGAMMAAFGTFEIVIRGRGSHGAMPHAGTDAILTAAQVVSALQSIVSRNVDPLLSAVVSVTQIRGGDTWNVLPDECLIRGTTRWYESTVGERIEERIAQLAHSVAAGFGCTARLKYERRYPATINDPASAQLVREVAGAIRLNVVDSPPTMGGEDFAFMLQAVPGCYLWLGAARAGENPGLHSARYDFNDEVLPAGVELWVSLVQRCLARP